MVDPGNESACLMVYIINDSDVEGIENFTFTVTYASGAELSNSNSTTITILDDDLSTSPSPTGLTHT